MAIAIVKEDRKSGEKEVIATVPTRGHKQAAEAREALIRARRQFEDGRTAVYAEEA